VPSIYGAYPRWWNLNGSCSYADTSPPWKIWRCASRADQTVGRLDVRIPGYTFERDNAVVPPTAANNMGYVAQFGRDSSGNLLSMTTTRNEGVAGVTGPTGCTSTSRAARRSRRSSGSRRCRSASTPSTPRATRPARPSRSAASSNSTPTSTAP